MKYYAGYLLLAVVLSGGLLAGAYFIPWRAVSWGTVTLAPASTLTVSGYAETKQKTQIATFTAGMTAVSDNRDDAVKEVNDKLAAIITSVQSFGIGESDIQTQNLNVYQMEESYWEEGRQKTRKGQWRVSNDISIKLRDVDKASGLADLLSKSGATNVYGPSFSLDDTRQAEADLLSKAVEDAKTKAATMAETSNKKLGVILSITEGLSSQPILYRAMEGGLGGGGGAPVQPGSSTVSKSVTVTFELK